MKILYSLCILTIWIRSWNCPLGGEYALSISAMKNWLAWFSSGNFEVNIAFKTISTHLGKVDTTVTWNFTHVFCPFLSSQSLSCKLIISELVKAKVHTEVMASASEKRIPNYDELYKMFDDALYDDGIEATKSCLNGSQLKRNGKQWWRSINWVNCIPTDRFFLNAFQ